MSIDQKGRRATACADRHQPLLCRVLGLAVVLVLFGFVNTASAETGTEVSPVELEAIRAQLIAIERRWDVLATKKVAEDDWRERIDAIDRRWNKSVNPPPDQLESGLTGTATANRYGELGPRMPSLESPPVGFSDPQNIAVVPRYDRPYAPVGQQLAMSRRQPVRALEVGGDFPDLPPSPYEQKYDDLPPLEQELWEHGGAYLYSAEGDRVESPEICSCDKKHALRLPEDFQAPRPLTAFTEFLGADPIRFYPKLKWPGVEGYQWEPAFVGYGSYELFASALEENSQRQDIVGHQLLLELDLRLTGTERFHVQFRPIGESNSGGSYYQFSDPSGYVDNSDAMPERYWFEGEIASIFGGVIKNQYQRDLHVVIGKFPFALQNSYLLNDDLAGVVVNKNNIYLGTLSNLNVQLFATFDADNAFNDGAADIYGTNITADYRATFIELSYANVRHSSNSGRNSNYLAASVTNPFGPYMASARGFFKLGDNAGTGDGQLFVFEANRGFVHPDGWFGIEKGIYYTTAFYNSTGWQSISGGNFNRLTSTFRLDPVISISTSRAGLENYGMALGAQWFRHHKDESLVAEAVCEFPTGQSVLGASLRYQRKTSQRSFVELQGVGTFSEDDRFRREGIFASHTILF